MKTVPLPADYGCVSITRTPRWHIPWPDFIGFMIMAGTWSRYDHCFIYVGGGQIVEAQPSGAAISSLAKYSGFEIVWSTDDLTNDQRDTIIDTAYKCAGKPYGFLDILAIFLRNLPIPTPRLNKIVLRQDRMICSQLVAWCGWEATVVKWMCHENYAQFVTPGQLARRLATRPPNLVRWWRNLTRMLHIA